MFYSYKIQLKNQLSAWELAATDNLPFSACLNAANATHLVLRRE